MYANDVLHIIVFTHHCQWSVNIWHCVSYIITPVGKKMHTSLWSTSLLCPKVCGNCLCQSKHIIRNEGGSIRKDFYVVWVYLICVGKFWQILHANKDFDTSKRWLKCPTTFISINWHTSVYYWSFFLTEVLFSDNHFLDLSQKQPFYPCNLGKTRLMII